MPLILGILLFVQTKEKCYMACLLLKALRLTEKPIDVRS